MSNKQIHWIKKNLFDGVWSSILTIVSAFIFVKFAYSFLSWAVFNASVNTTATQCRENEHGACWSFIQEKARYIVFGSYPDESLWRPILALILFVVIVIASTQKKFWSKWLVYSWFGYLFLAGYLMKGGLFLEPVEATLWGGLPLTLMLSVIGIGASYPIGILLALGRRSTSMPAVRSVCVAYIELIRGVPLISLLFMASVMFPLFLPEGLTVNKLFRAQAAIIMFSSAYVAEVVRGGLQAIPSGQYEGAFSLGLNYVQTMRLIILPQALKIVIPPTVSTFISMFKDTSLVVIIALFDLMYTAKTSLSDVNWLGFSSEAYVFIGLIYFVFCYSMSRFSRFLEEEFYTGR